MEEEQMSTIKTKDVLVEVKKKVMYVTLNRPDRLNAFSPDMLTALKQALTEAKQDASIHVVVLKGSGRAFSAGGDVKQMEAGIPARQVRTYWENK